MTDSQIQIFSTSKPRINYLQENSNTYKYVMFDPQKSNYVLLTVNMDLVELSQIEAEQ